MRQTNAQLDDRRKWAKELYKARRGRCMGCGCGYEGGPLEVHEIQRRSSASGRWAQRCNYLLLCRECHAEEFATMCHAEQLAVKFSCDQEHYDLEAWLRIADPELRAPLRVTMEEVEYYVGQLTEVAR